MIIYRIKGPQGSITRKRVDAAKLALSRMTYEAIEANAGLDTAWGHRMMSQAESANWSKGGAISCSHFTIFYTCSHA